MNPPPPPPSRSGPDPEDPTDGRPAIPAEADDLDRAASDALDGLERGLELDPDALDARIAHLRRATSALADQVQQPATHMKVEQVQQAVGAAETEPQRAPIRPIARPRAQGQRLGRWAAVAAVAIALVVGAVLVEHLTHEHAPGGVTATASRPAGTATPPESAASSPVLGQSGTTSYAALPNLGSATDADALAALVARQPGRSPRASGGATHSTTARTGAAASPLAGQATPPATTTCEAQVRATRPGLGPVTLAGRATLAGAPVVVLVFEAGPGQPEGRLIATRSDGCQVLVDRQA